MYVCRYMCVCMYVGICVCMYVGICVCMYVCTYRAKVFLSRLNEQCLVT